jgi:hypothetical protein
MKIIGPGYEFEMQKRENRKTSIAKRYRDECFRITWGSLATARGSLTRCKCNDAFPSLSLAESGWLERISRFIQAPPDKFPSHTHPRTRPNKAALSVHVLQRERGAQDFSYFIFLQLPTMTGLVEDVEVTIVQADWVGRDIFLEKILYWIGWSRIRSGRINLDEILEKNRSDWIESDQIRLVGMNF